MQTTVPANATVLAADLDLRGNWDTIWSAVSGDSKAPLILGIFGTIVVLFALIAFIWARRRGGGGGGGGGGGQNGRTAFLIGAMVVGALCAAPTVILPLGLGVFDLVGNICIRLVERVLG